MIEFIIQLSDGTKAVHQLKDKVVTIGRDTDNMTVIADGSVSRHHAEVKIEGGIHTLHDLDSANGTTVNDEPITARILKDGDVVCFGTIRAMCVVRPPPPAPIEPAVVTEIVHPSPGRRRAVVIGIVSLVVLSTIVFLVDHLRHAHGRTSEIAAVDKHKGQNTRTYWDKVHQIEAMGNAQNKRLSFGEYLRSEKGMFDFQWFDDKAFESFLEKLNTRSKRGGQVIAEINQLDKSDVDADLLAYTEELCSQWKSASDLDLYFAQYVEALYKQHKELEHPPSQDDLQALEQQWKTKRDELLVLSTKVIAREKSTGDLLTARYQMAFKE